MAQPHDDRPIVVGVDGSESSKIALSWAVRQAGLEGAPVQAVIAWTFPAYYGWAPPISDQFDFGSNARTVVEQTIKEVLGEHPPVPLSVAVVEGNAAQALVDASRSARLLVVGNRGHGGFSEALLGSVSQHCTHHAACPVIVIRDSNVRNA
ncbi:MAG TPA: universal stress protein [Micromonosporaceae bacterium]|jgi:nucleotide-binding universal stress UspA family protein|nr:universal stress protein [Micromonosporaceae bacterium]